MLAAIEGTMDAHPEDRLPPRRAYEDAAASGWSRRSTRIPSSASSSSASSTWAKIKAADKRLLVEPLYRSGAGWFTGLLGDGRITVRELHTERNPFFGGVNPEPIRPNVDAWLEEIPAGAPISG